ncbi:MAG: dolichol kinase [Candidatus Bathyarchaeota archaeon]|nr:dolichol kinase [Candidatus Bathyarchaeota archaeon]
MISIEEIAATVLLFGWVIFVATVLTKSIYEWMRKRGTEHNVAVYYNRKILHILAGGFCAVVVPFVFKTAFFPFVMAMLLAAFIYTPHKIGKIMYWFQTEENKYEVSFCIMWGTIITLGWLFSGGEFWIGVLPALFMSVGDAVTGIVRNFLYKKRTKSWWGNLTMALFSMFVGAALGVGGILAGAAASIVEHFEFPPVDDNITVPSISFLILILAKVYAPGLLAL